MFEITNFCENGKFRIKCVEKYDTYTLQGSPLWLMTRGRRGGGCHRVIKLRKISPTHKPAEWSQFSTAQSKIYINA